MEYVLRCETSNLGVEPMPCFAYCLGDLELALFVVPNAANSNSSTEIPEHAVVSLTYDGLECFDLFTQLVVSSNSSVDLRRQYIELASDVCQFLENASSTEPGCVLREAQHRKYSTDRDHLPDRLWRPTWRIPSVRFQGEGLHPLSLSVFYSVGQSFVCEGCP